MSNVAQQSPKRTPREAFAEFESIERRFGLDDSPLFIVLRALVDQGEEHAIALAELKGGAL